MRKILVRNIVLHNLTLVPSFEELHCCCIPMRIKGEGKRKGTPASKGALLLITN